jgi:hypothetical protein
MITQFNQVAICQWHCCSFRFRGRTCGHNSLHVTGHLQRMKARQCLWNACLEVFESYEKLAYHVSAKHSVPNDWTMLTKMHYCYEHDFWCCSEQQWVQHIRHDHFLHLNEFCGLIRQAGVVVIAAHCLLCLGDILLPMATRFAQFPDLAVLQKHMKQHLSQLSSPLTSCPHPRDSDLLASESAFWEHANSVHGSPALESDNGLGKRKTVDGKEEGQDVGAPRMTPERLCAKRRCDEVSPPKTGSEDCTLETALDNSY